MKFCLFLLNFLLPVLATGSELGRVVLPLEEPTVTQARKVLDGLAALIAEGDARTVTLGKKMERSVRRIFTAEHQVLEAKKKADEQEERAKQLDLNGRKWLRPNVHGRINKLAAQAAFEESRAIRLKSKWRREELSEEWAREVADFEKMLGDLEFSKEEQALLVLAEALVALVERTPWVERPPLAFNAGRLAFLKERVANRDRWRLLGRAAEDAQDFELAYDFYRQSGDANDQARAGRKHAEKLLLDGFPGSALNYLERIGEKEMAAALGQKFPSFPPESYRPLPPASLKRNVAPACVRLLNPEGFQSGFFVKAGGYLITCKDGLRNKEGEIRELRVVLEDGRSFRPELVRESDQSDLALLRIDCGQHELIPVGVPEEAGSGSKLTLFGFTSRERNTPEVLSGTVLNHERDENRSPILRLALDGSPGQRGAPFVSSRGRVLGIFLASKTGSTTALGGEAIRAILDRL